MATNLKTSLTPWTRHKTPGGSFYIKDAAGNNVARLPVITEMPDTGFRRTADFVVLQNSPEMLAILRELVVAGTCGSAEKPVLPSRHQFRTDGLGAVMERAVDLLRSMGDL